MGGDEVDTSIVTPARSPGFFAILLGSAAVLGFNARLGAWLARRAKRPFRLGKKIIAARHDHVCELLSRDLDFGIASVNAVKVGEVNHGAFVLGMDRSEPLERERRALYESLAAVDMGPLRQGIAAEIESRLSAIPTGGEIDVVGGYARPIAAHTAQRLFGITGSNDRMFMEVVRSVFGHTFLNVGNDAAIRERAVRAGDYMTRWFGEEIARRRADGHLGDDMMGRLLRQGIVDDDGVRRTLGGMLVGSIDTTATCVAKIVTMAGRDQQLEIGIRRDLGDLDRLYGWCNEALRRWPHNPIVLRRATTATSLAGRPVAAGSALIAWIHAAMYDVNAFPEPLRLRPDRDTGAYLHLGAGLHPCSGRPVNRFQIPMLVGALVGRGLARVGRVRWAGPFPNELPAILDGGRG